VSARRGAAKKSSSRRRAGLLLALAALGLALAGCSSYPSTGVTPEALGRIGFRPVKLTPGRTVRVHLGIASLTQGDANEAAGVVWTTLPFRFDRLDVTVDAPGGGEEHTFTHAQLTARFGPRDPSLDRRTYSRGILAAAADLLRREALPAVVVVLGAAFVLFVGRPRPAGRAAAT
jgi:hypothetical protein